jgi:hypothetical protein
VYVDIDMYVKAMILTLNYLRLCFLINRLVPFNIRRLVKSKLLYYH